MTVDAETTGVRGRRGGTLVVVLFFASFVMITLVIYLFSQQRFSALHLRRSSSLQALLNARSGIWKGLAMLSRPASHPERPEDIEDLDTVFGGHLLADEAVDSVSALEPTLEVDGGPVELDLYGDTALGGAVVELRAAGNILELVSQGTFRSWNPVVTATLASTPFVNPDTVVFLSRPGALQGGGTVEGEVHAVEMGIDSSENPTESRDRFTVDRTAMNKHIGSYRERLGAFVDTSFQDPPLRIERTSDLDKVEEFVNGSLFLEGTFGELVWRSDRTLHVLEDVQITGDVRIEGVELVIGGELKALDDAVLRDVDVFCQGRMFLGDRCRFAGNALVLKDIEIYGEAVVERGSIIVGAGGPGKRPGKEGKTVTGRFSTFVRDNARFDGVLAALDENGSIRTEPDTELRGILWAESKVCHEGTISGVIKARELVGMEQASPDEGEGNVLRGRVSSLPEIEEYIVPYYVGLPRVVEWAE